MKLRGEDQTNPWEYKLCLERMALLKHLLDKGLGTHPLSSNTKPHP